jgi:hypothetical protein
MARLHGKNKALAHQKRRHHTLVSADQLFKRKVTLVDQFVVEGDSLTGGIRKTSCSSNGITDGIGAAILPQPRIFTQYAEMFEFYQVDRIKTRFIPYKYENRDAS